MITVENVSFNYRRKKPDLLHNFSLNFEKGKIYGLLGKNGAGKSTLLYLMSGLLTPKTGRVMYNDINVRRRLPATLGNMFIVPEEFDLPKVPLKTFVSQNALFYPHFSKENMDSCLKCFEMPEDIHLGALSMGQKKKVYMSFALATGTSLLLMDEPTNGLDIPSKSQFRKLIASDMTNNRTMIISTHQVADINKMLDHVVIIDNSHVLLNASIATITKNLLFKELKEDKKTEETIYSEPSANGHLAVFPNAGNEDSAINLELLFNATLSMPERISSLFQS